MDEDKLPEQGKPVKSQTEPEAPESGPLSLAAHSETDKVDEKIKAGTERVFAITSSGLVPATGPGPHHMTRVYRAKTGKWEYMSTEGNPGPSIDGGDGDAALPDEAQGT